MSGLEKGPDGSLAARDITRRSSSAEGEYSGAGILPSEVATKANGHPAVPQSVIVDWDGPDDPDFPMNWPLRKKWTVTMVMVYCPPRTQDLQ